MARKARQRPNNTSSAEGGTFDKNLSEDVDSVHKGPNQWTQARNAVNNTTLGDLGELSNEASNYLCAHVLYPIIGNIHLGADEWAIFSTDDVNSEIGLFKEDSCSYEAIVNDPCLDFRKDHLIKGVGRTTADCGRQVYWATGIHPDRLLNIDDVPYIQIPDPNNTFPCNDTIDSADLDCDKLRLAPIITDLAFRVEEGNASGQIINGQYYVVGAYLVNGQKITDYSLPSNIQGLFTHQNVASSLDIYIEEADESFDEFELVLVQFANFNTVARQIGVYSTRQKKITLDTIHETLPTIDPGLILLQNTIPDMSDAIFRNGEYLIRTGPTDKFDFNYQPLANQITSHWVSVEHDADYYRKGGHDTGYMRDEVYSFFIRWVWNTGDKSKSYHLPGRNNNSFDLAGATGPDVVLGDPTVPVNWNVYNTAAIDDTYPGLGTVLPNGGVIVGYGDMAYWESSEIYDDNSPEIWDASAQTDWGPTFLATVVPIAHDLCGKKIRHHKFPDNACDRLTSGQPDINTAIVTNHYDPINGEKIRIMGIEFDNIQAPLDNAGVPISNIVGYEILRGSREGNKSVLAKGMINNLREYITNDQGTTKTFLYPNYPYNPTAPVPSSWGIAANPNLVVDHFLSSTGTQHDGGGIGGGPNTKNAFLRDDLPLGYGNVFPSETNIKKDLLTFHSPETNFRDPFLSAKEIKVYGELHGDMIGKFQYPKDHPRNKFITNTSFLVSAVVGIGYAIISQSGAKTITRHSPKMDFGGTYSQVGVSTGTTGLFGSSAVAASAIISAGNAASAGDKTIEALFGNSSPLSVLWNMGGTGNNIIRDNALLATNAIAGTAAGIDGGQSTSHTETKVDATPIPLRFFQAVPMFLTHYAEGVDNMLNIIYAFTPYRQYALQQISHCFYNSFERPDVGDIRRGIDYQSYLHPELQDFAQDYRINNIYRSRTVALKLNTSLALPYKGAGADDTQAIFSDVWDRDIPADDEKWKKDEHINTSFERPATSHYVAMKQQLDNQYGQLAGIIQVPVSTDATVSPRIDPAKATSPVLYNGDVYIGRYTEKNTMFFFYDWLKGQPDGAGYNYNLRKMVTHPRFWMDTDPFDAAEFVSSVGNLFSLSGGSAPGGFDPFMLNPGINITDPNGDPLTNPYVPLTIGGNPNPNYPICNCVVQTGCNPDFDTNDLEEICDLKETVYQLDMYLDFIDACACVKQDGVDGCNEDLMLEPWNEEPYTGAQLTNLVPSQPAYNQEQTGGCQADYAIFDSGTHDTTDSLFYGCANCPTWNDEDNYLEKGTGKWSRKMKKIGRKIKKAQKKLDRKIKKLYKKYIDQQDPDGGGIFDGLMNALVTPSDKYGFDQRKSGAFKLTVKEAFMYLFNSGTRDFFVETEINIDSRDWGESLAQRHYDHERFTNLAELYSTDHIKTGNHMEYDYSLSISKLFNNFVSWGVMQPKTYNPLLAESCHIYRPKRMLYSLKQSLENRKDNWRIFLPLNFKDFNSIAVNIKPIGKNGAMILFENESPVQFLGVDRLQTDAGTKITIGDGGLFSQPLQNLANAEYPHEYGSCQNRLAVANTPAGLFYMSQNQGKIFTVGGKGIQEISNLGMKWWFANYLPYQLTKDPTAFIDPITGDPNPFQLTDNPVVGIGCQTIFDNKNQIVFFTKKDYIVRTDISDTVVYVSGRIFRVNGVLDVELGDPAYFAPASWTVSFDPKTQGWIAYHDWHPDLVLPSKKTFMTTKGNEIWVHADRCDSYCNFYGVDYPFEVEYSLHTQVQVNTLRNVMYMMEVYKYEDNCDDRFHVLDFNFDEAVVYNSEQCSGLLRLNITPKNNAPAILNFPTINSTSIDILFAKEEHKYRFNQFWDITDDRGEFNPTAERTIFNTQPNGYIKDLNPANLNYTKFALERKKFRHYKNTVLLRRNVSGNRNMIIALAVQMNLNSPR